MNANPNFLNSEAEIDQASTSSFPNSRKVYAAGSADDIRVPMREVRQSSTAGVEGDEENPPFFIYDTSGPYTDPEVKVNIQEGLPSYASDGSNQEKIRKHSMAPPLNTAH
jgi:phosphomethylpyrimidine synthase